MQPSCSPASKDIVPRRDSRRVLVNAGLNKIVNRLLMTGMNRLSPLIRRRERAFAGIPAGLPASERRDDAQAAASIADDVKLFATAWCGGLVFFLTYLG